MSDQVIHALYDDDDVLLGAVKAVVKEKHHIEEVYTPFPVHGLDKAMGLEETRISIMAFIYGCIGLSVTVFFAAHLMVITFYLRSRLWPFKKAENPNPLTTDDKFLMEIALGKNEKALKDLLKKTGAIDIQVIDKAH
ncbi:MAG: DUF3341 domain-containing protein [Flavobacteriia bacterium]|nr:DUF3341 domain-containing protein [Flavobacteriia bacterium]